MSKNKCTTRNRRASSWVAAGFAGLALAGVTQASDQIIKPLQSVRSSGMGGLKLTTGLYEDNFFGNPARVIANPKWRVTIFDPTVETSRSTITNAGDVASNSSDGLAGIGGTAGNNNHGRIQLSMLSFYIPKGDRRWALAVSPLLTSIQFDVMLRNSYQLSPSAIADIGPALTYGRTFFSDERLTLGITPHVTARVATNSNFTMADLISGKSLSPGETGGAGAHFDFDMGSTYRLPLKLGEFGFDAAFAVNNVLGGKYKNLKAIKLGSTDTPPPAQPRTFGFGIAGSREEWGKFRNTVFGLEIQDLGNNPNGSLFRTVHLGGETNWRRIALRAGL
ncbi:hypothetical protein EBZ37_06910, partial [bacterium]|nr:hypothetical protein [bacterium]